VMMWDVQTGRPVPNARVVHQSLVRRVAFSPPAANLVASLDEKGTVMLSDAATLQPRGNIQLGDQSVWGMAFSPTDPHLIAFGRENGSIELWDPQTRAHIGDLSGGHTEQVWTLAFSPDGTTLASGSNDNSIGIWDVASRTLKARLLGHRDD